MKVYQISDYDWVAAPSAGEALAWARACDYIPESEADLLDITCFDEPRELTDEEMDRLIHTGDDGAGPNVSFRSRLAEYQEERNHEIPYLFASTEW
jgi:hypothetical protein